MSIEAKLLFIVLLAAVCFSPWFKRLFPGTVRVWRDELGWHCRYER